MKKNIIAGLLTLLFFGGIIGAALNKEILIAFLFAIIGAAIIIAVILVFNLIKDAL